jgi:phenylacetate-CoA ligase
MERYVRVTNSYKPQIIRGYAHALYEISKFVEKKKLSIHKPKLIVSTAEVLHDYMREKIETAFNARVFNVYGCREVDGIAGECMEGRMHIFAFNNYVEVLDDNNNAVREGENGKVVVTNLHNYSMPFIRYCIGDMAVLGPKKCTCGNPLPTLEKVTGRICSILRKKDGTIISSFSISRIFQRRETVKAYRVVQEDYDRIRVMVVFGEQTSVEREKRDIEQKINAVMGKECKVIFEVVDEIPKTEAGKYLPVQTLLSEVPSNNGSV